MKKILFTGARSGIAAAVIKKIIDKDFYIYITVHTDSQLKAISKTYINHNNVQVFKLDVKNENDIRKLENLDIDILVSNAAIGYGGSILEIPIDKIRENFETNVIANFNLIQKVISKMIKKNDGKIIVISSLAAIIPINFIGVYSATKASISRLTINLKNELKLLNSNIKVVLIEPGTYHTGFNQVMLDNKYDWMHYQSYFKNQLTQIRNQEQTLFSIIEKKSLDSITKKIVKAINSPQPKFIYRAPLSQAIAAKIYNLIFY